MICNRDIISLENEIPVLRLLCVYCLRICQEGSI